MSGMPSLDGDDWLEGIRDGLREDEDHPDGPEATSNESTHNPAFPSFGRYAVENLLGEGTTAVVYRATDLDLNRPVALKVLRESGSLSETARERFRREAQVMAALTHPHLVTLFDAGEHQGRLFLALELVEGRSLVEVLAGGVLDLPSRIHLLEKASRGVGAAHEKGIVHRDLKPANILITSSGEPKVGDFGLAHVGGLTAVLTRTVATLGTPLYMAPEQVEGRSGEVTPAADVYALGAILYELLTGRTPHGGDSFQEVYRKVVREDPAIPRRLNREVSVDLETIALKALDKNPRRRYANASAFAEDLRRCLAGEPINARPLPRHVRVWRTVRKQRAVLIPAVLILLIIGIAFTWAHFRATTRARGLLAEASSREAEGRLREAKDLFTAVLKEKPRSLEAQSGLSRVEASLDRQAHETKVKELAEKAALELLEATGPDLQRIASMARDRNCTDADYLQQIERTSRQIKTCIEKAPHLAPGHYRLGLLAESTGDYRVAEECTRRAIQLDAGFAAAHYQLGRVLFAQALRLNLDPGTTWPEQQESRAEGLLRSTAEEIERALALDKNAENSLSQDVARGLLAYVRGETEKTLAIARRGAESYSTSPGREEFYWLEGLAQSEEARIPTLEKAIGLRPKWPLVRWARAKAGIYHNAYVPIVHLTMVLRMHPEDVPSLTLRGIGYILVGNPTAAYEDLSLAIKLGSVEAIAYAYRGEAIRRRASTSLDREYALADFSRSSDLNPTYASTYYFRGLLFSDDRKFDSAVQDFTRVIELDPKSTAAYLDRGRVYFEQGVYGRAIDDFSRAIDLNPSYSNAYAWRGRARERMGDKAGAETDTERARELMKKPR